MKTIKLYVHDGGPLHGRCSFSVLTDAAHKIFQVSVPDGSRLVGEGRFTFLVTPDGKARSASDVHSCCQSGSDGLCFVDDGTAGLQSTHLSDEG